MCQHGEHSQGDSAAEKVAFPPFLPVGLLEMPTGRKSTVHALLSAMDDWLKSVEAGADTGRKTMPGTLKGKQFPSLLPADCKLSKK